MLRPACATLRSGARAPAHRLRAGCCRPRAPDPLPAGSGPAYAPRNRFMAPPRSCVTGAVTISPRPRVAAVAGRCACGRVWRHRSTRPPGGGQGIPSTLRRPLRAREYAGVHRPSIDVSTRRPTCPPSTPPRTACRRATGARHHLIFPARAGAVVLRGITGWHPRVARRSATACRPVCAGDPRQSCCTRWGCCSGGVSAGTSKP